MNYQSFQSFSKNFSLDVSLFNLSIDLLHYPTLIYTVAMNRK